MTATRPSAAAAADNAGGPDVEVTGQRVEALLEDVAAADPAARAAAENLVRELLGLYGAGLERLVGLLRAVAPEAAGALGEDPLLAGLLALHDLHPVDAGERVRAALAAFPEVRLVSVSDETVTLAVASGCSCCGTHGLPAGVEQAVLAAAPEIARVELDPADAAPRQGGLIPVSALLSRSSRNGS